MTPRLAGLLLWLCEVALACKPSGSGKGTPSAVQAKARATPAPASVSAAQAAPPAPPRGCRVLTLTGDVRRLEGDALRPGESFDGGAWLSFEAGASATFRHAESTREWTLIGPGRMRPCRGGDEQVAVANGRLRTSSGAGARPGAEVMVFTPHGVLRYGDATLDLEVSQQQLSALAKSGEVWLEPLEGKAAAIALALGKPKVAALKRQKTSLEQRCDALAQRASELGRELTGTAPSSGAALSARAVEHLKARREARFVCGAGESYAASLEPPERGRLLDRFAELERLYRAFPRRAAAQDP